MDLSRERGFHDTCRIGFANGIDGFEAYDPTLVKP